MRRNDRINDTSSHVHHGQGGSTVRHMSNTDLGRIRQLLLGDVGDGADARGAMGDFARLRTRCGNQFCRRLDAALHRNRHYQRVLLDHGNRHQIIHHIQRRLLHRCRRGYQRRRIDQQHRAILGALRHCRRAKHGGGSWLVLHDDVAAGALRELNGNRAGKCVRAGARSGRNNDANEFGQHHRVCRRRSAKIHQSRCAQERAKISACRHVFSSKFELID
ncbi:hypothetical protein SDC9_101399 [bioreactor metagenome]|uniref:Uncharacterized protein n=1 Tax=bioreactor metagenome TaxID=1076179 RepID=A0A645AND8_9ZZZZ